jgi:hypothetical protein
MEEKTNGYYQLEGAGIMSELVPFGVSGIVTREGRQASRAISRSKARTYVRIAEADDSTDVTLAKVENLTMATGSVMQQVVRVTKAQRELEQLAPEASARLNYLADDHMLGCSELLADLRRELHRNR